MTSRPGEYSRSLLAVLVLLGCALGACSSALPASRPAAAILQPGDLAAMAGTWTGSLVYKDYTSGKSTTLPVKAVGTLAGEGGRRVTLHIAYPDEPSHDGDHDYTVSDDGRTVGGVAVIERTQAPDGALRIVLEERGLDGNDSQPATFRHVLLVSPGSLVITKWVSTAGSTDFFERNEYRLAR